jgi:hypothetical protein
MVTFIRIGDSPVKKYLMLMLCVAIAVSMVLALGTPPAHAIKNFRDQFKEKYVKEGSDDAKDKAFAEAFEEAKCNVCHEGKSKKQRNVYGVALSELLDKKEDKDNVEKIQKALATVEEKKSNPDDAGSPTFGALIQDGKLPGGTPK